MDKVSLVILAAGKGTRLKVDTPKPLLDLGGKPLVEFVMDQCVDLGELSVIVGHQHEEVQKKISEKFQNIEFILQKEQLGTGHAVQTFFQHSEQVKNSDYVVIVCADTPLIEKETIKTLISKVREGLDAACATTRVENPFGYGRIIESSNSKGFHIVEEKDCNDEQQRVSLINSGVYCFKTKYLAQEIAKLNNENNNNEFYLTDVFKEQSNTLAVEFTNSDQFIGVNTQAQLSEVEELLVNKIKSDLMSKGVRFINPATVQVYTSDIGAGSVIFPNNYIDAYSTIGENVTIESSCIIRNSIISSAAQIKASCYIDSSYVGSSSKVGPMAQLRPGTKLGENVKIGNFVEIKKSEIANNTNVSHLSYVGDAQISEDVNIGCGFITCNYDGARKHKTIIGKGSFIGSDCQMIAPISIGENCYVGSGSTINQDIPDGAFAIARSRQTTKEGMAKKFIKYKDK